MCIKERKMKPNVDVDWSSVQEESNKEMTKVIYKDNNKLKVTESNKSITKGKRGPKPKPKVERSAFSGGFSETMVKGIEKLYLDVMKNDPLQARNVSYSSIIWDLVLQERELLKHNVYTCEDIKLKYSPSLTPHKLRRSYQLPISSGNEVIQEVISTIEQLGKIKLKRSDFLHHLVRTRCLEKNIELN